MNASLLESETDFLPATSHPWRVLRVETGHELQARRGLEDRQIDCYLPTFQQVRRYGRHKPETITRALFPGYLFSRFSHETFSLTLNAPRIIDLLRFGARAAEIEPDEMTRIQTLASLESAQPWERLAEGDPVRIIDGPLRGNVGRLIQRRSQTCVAVEIQMLNRGVSVVVESWALARV